MKMLETDSFIIILYENIRNWLYSQYWGKLIQILKNNMKMLETDPF